MTSLFARRGAPARRALTATAVGAALITATALPLATAVSAQAAGTDYYVDCSAGSDANAGTSATAAWRSLSPVNGRTFAAGSTVYLRRGCSWDGGLVAKSSGVSGSPVTYTAYGTGTAPTVRNSGGGMYGSAVSVTGDYNVVDGLLARDSGSAAVLLKAGADHNVVRNVEATAAGIGIEADGQYNLVTRDNVHDTKMIVNTPGGDDDYGATCYWLAGANNELSYNRGVNCTAPSYDYGSDGGFVEVWQNGDNSYIHNNFSQNTNGYFEIGGAGSAQNIRVAYNVIREPHGGLCLHDNGSFSINYSNLRFENNTMVADAGGYRVVDCTSSLSTAKLIMRNNVFSINYPIANTGSFTHQNNIYNLTGASVGYTLGAGEKTASPAFANRSGGDFHLSSGSPAIDAGQSIGYTKDYDDNPVAVGIAPDAGAFEFGAAAPAPAATSTPTPTPVPVPATTVTSLNDSATSTAATQFSYSGSWTLATGSGKYLNDDHYSNTAGSSYTVKFTGTLAKLYVATAAWHGQAAVSVDGGPETTIDCYSAAKVDQVLKYTSPVLAAGMHTLRVRITGGKNAASTGTYVTADRVDVTS